MYRTRRVIPAVKPRLAMQKSVPGSIRFLTMLLCLYLAAPLFDIPLLGLSISAPILFMLALEVERRLGGLRLSRLGRIPVFLIMIWVGQLVSLALAEYLGDQQPDLTDGGVTLLRYAFWFIVCCLSARIFLEGNIIAVRAVRYFAYGCEIVAVSVLIEYFLFGGLKSSGWSAFTTLSQNSYGWQFSAFLPFVAYGAFSPSGRVKPWGMLGLIGALLAVLVNASRSSWGTAALGLILFVLMRAIQKRNKGSALKIMVILTSTVFIGAMSMTLLPEDLLQKIQDRPITSAELESDKSWQIRLLMIQKGKLLFFEHPVFGVGPGQFKNEVADLVIPAMMQYNSNEYFNKKSAHNSYMQLLAEGGLVLAIPFGLLLLWLFIKGGQAALQLAWEGETWAIPVWVSFVCFSIHYWTVAGITTTAPWFLYGYLGAVILRAEKGARGPSR